MFDLYTNFDVIFLPNLTDKIHYQIFDSLGNVVQVLVDNDGKSTTGVSRTDNDGAPVAGIDQVLAYNYNVKGEQTTLLRDNNVDGKYDYREAYTLDANGRWIEKFIDLTNDGQFDRKEVYTKSASDAYLKTEFYNIVDGRDVVTKIEHYENNANNQRTALKVDTLGDSSINIITKYDLDEFGRISKAYFDIDGNGAVDRIESYTRDSNGVIKRTEFSNTEGVIEAVRTYEHNALNQVVETNRDNGNDGIIDERYTYTRDIYGNEQAYQYYSYNPITSQLELFRSAERTFNELNQRETQKTTNATTGLVENTTYTYDEYGRTSTEVTTNNNGGGNSYKYSYYEDGTVHIREDYNVNGQFTSKSVYLEYDSRFSNLPLLIESYNAQNSLTNTAKIFRNENGGWVTSLLDYTNNGTGWDTYMFGNRSASLHFNVKEDWTEWSNEQLAQLGDTLSLIRMGTNGISELTLNAEVVAKISNGGLRVQGAADKNDVLNLSGFDKATSSDVRGYDLYTASFEGEDLKLYVQANDSISVIG